MNKQRRKEIERAIELLDEAKTILDSALSEEQEYYDNVPENLQTSERYYASEQAIETLEESISSIEEITGNLTDNI